MKKTTVTSTNTRSGIGTSLAGHAFRDGPITHPTRDELKTAIKVAKKSLNFARDGSRVIRF